MDEMRAVRDNVVKASATQLDTLAVKPWTIFLVAAYHTAGYWKIHRDSARDEYLTEEAARAAAKELAPAWILRHVITVTLPEGGGA